MKLLTEALRGDPDNAVAAKLLRLIKKGEALKEQGNAAFKAGKWEAAIAAYSEALTLDPANNVFNSKLLCNRATALGKAGKTAEAIADYGESIRADEGYAKAYLRRAVALQAMGDAESLQEAVRDLSKAKELLGGGGGGGGAPGGGGGGASDENAQVLRDVEVELKKARAALKKAKKKDYYKLLEVDRGADDFEEALKKAYRKAALKWHPDRWSTGTEAEKKKAEAMFKDVTEANTVLSDPQQKARYDASVDGDGDFDPSGTSEGCGGGGHSMGGMSQQDLCVCTAPPFSPTVASSPPSPHPLTPHPHPSLQDEDVHVPNGRRRRDGGLWRRHAVRHGRNGWWWGHGRNGWWWLPVPGLWRRRRGRPQSRQGRPRPQPRRRATLDRQKTLC